MLVNKKVTRKSAIKASNARVRRHRAIRAAEEDEMIEDVDVDVEGNGGVDVAPEASDLLFEAEDVAELIAEVTAQPVEVTVDDDTVEFAIGDDVYTVTPEGDEEIVEDSKRVRRSASSVRAGRAMRRPTRRPAMAARRTSAPRSVDASRRVSAARRASAARRVAATRRVSAARRPATQK